jgi:hypothetical protein
MRNKKKISIEEYNGGKLDKCVINGEKDAEELFKRWKNKGFF